MVLTVADSEIEIWLVDAPLHGKVVERTVESLVDQSVVKVGKIQDVLAL